ncbi:MAG TPA: YbaK/EbsC family protein [Bacteroidales bacterium]|jgi:Ala-tRNA(Pro) deacylase|nr:YbaK/EbsC family protein [Bacteroidales bacterium]MDD4236325.1 YbaK/EbsC family protein [Bacteroidales bacterium]MDY0161290.1 YbaK/EbsC family protein [Bacteroidales bacterium]HXK81018.1 YbaK/EbsC family protein [Bacteroidales bacterium]
MIGQAKVYEILDSLNIKYRYYESPTDFSSEDDGSFWDKIGALRCKNLFLRNHKGNRHFMIIAPYYADVSITALEQYFKKGKISFASDKRLSKWLNVKPGAVSVFSLINDTENHVEVFVDERLKQSHELTFLPNMHNALLAITYHDFISLLNNSGNKWQFFDFSI